jgi:hypothetical protein
MRDIRSTRAYSLFIFTLVCSLISASIINSNISIGKDAFAKKTKTSSDRANGHGSSGSSREKANNSPVGSDSQSKKDNKLIEPIVPSVQTPTNSKFVIINLMTHMKAIILLQTNLRQVWI